MSFECSECHSKGKDLVCDETKTIGEHSEAKIACTNCLHWEWI